MQRCNPNDFQMMEEISFVHLLSPENLACTYQMLQSVERTDGKWQHIISFQWICVLPEGYNWVSLNISRFLHFYFSVLFPVKLSFPSLYHLCRCRLVSDSFLAVRESQNGSHRWRKDPKGGEALCSCSYYMCCGDSQALINGEESWGEKGQKSLMVSPSPPCPVEQIFNL